MKSSLTQMDLAVYQLSIESHDQRNENHELWFRGCMGDSLSQADSVLFENLITNKNDIVFVQYRHNLAMGRENVALGVTHDLAGFLFLNPGPLKAWLAREKAIGKLRSELSGSNEWSFWMDLINSHIEKTGNYWLLMIRIQIIQPSYHAPSSLFLEMFSNVSRLILKQKCFDLT